MKRLSVDSSFNALFGQGFHSPRRRTTRNHTRAGKWQHKQTTSQHTCHEHPFSHGLNRRAAVRRGGNRHDQYRWWPRRTNQQEEWNQRSSADPKKREARQLPRRDQKSVAPATALDLEIACRSIRRVGRSDPASQSSSWPGAWPSAAGPRNTHSQFIPMYTLLI